MLCMDSRYKVNLGTRMPRGNTADKAVEGIVDVTKVAVTGMTAVGVIGAVGSAFKK